MEKKDQWRPKLHLTPPKGWLNDPNGLCQFHGEYHVFFQYSPDQPEGGRKYWGHYIGKDLLHWEFAGIACSPDHPFDKNGVYSGSALICNDQMHLFYTGNVKLDGDYNYITNGREGNTVTFSSRDGRIFSEKECLLRNEDYPDDLTCHVRDPKVVTGKSIGIEDQNYYMFLGARTSGDVGEVLLYKSSDLKAWTLENVITSEEPFGFMWECPDAFMLEDTTILSISPQGVEQDGWNYQNIYQSGYYKVTGSLASDDYQLGAFKEWDRGFDFYAPQTFEDEQGRRILIGWIGMPDAAEHYNRTLEDGWQNALTLPRELTIQDGRILQYPVRELEQQRRSGQELQVGEQTGEMSSYDVEVRFQNTENWTIAIAEGLTFTWSKADQLCTLQFDPEKDLGCGRTRRDVQLSDCDSVRLIVDRSCIEMYLNGGEEVFTTWFYPEDGTSSVQVTGDGGMQIRCWELEEMEIKLFT